MEHCLNFIRSHKLVIGQISSYCLGGIFIGIIELPNDTKNISYLPIEITAVIFYLFAFVIKLYKEGRKIFKSLLMVYIKNFLIWTVSLISIIFAFSLTHEVGWVMAETIILTVCSVISTSTLVIICHHDFISKM